MSLALYAELGPDERVSNASAVAVESVTASIIVPGSSGSLGTPSSATHADLEGAVRGARPLGGEALRADTSRPTDVAWATYGPPPPPAESIFGPDDRVRVADPAAYPWRMNASLQILAPDNNLYVGTGWFIGPRTLVTAGHCVFIHDQQGRYNDWARAIRVMPGRDGTNLPYGAVVATEFASVVGWCRDKDARYDYAVIKLPTADLGDRLGWYGIGIMGDADLVGRGAHIAGYPGDKQGAEDGTQWYDARQINAVDPQQIHYEVDTWGGQSGSAVWVVDGDQRVAVGIHAYGASYFGNSATRITSKVYENLKAWL